MNRDNTGTSYFADSNGFPLQYAYQDGSYGRAPNHNSYPFTAQPVNAYGGQDLGYNYPGVYAGNQYGYIYAPNVPYYGNGGGGQPVVSNDNSALYPEWSTTTSGSTPTELETNLDVTSTRQNSDSSSSKNRRFSAQRSNKEGRSNVLENTSPSGENPGKYKSVSKPIRFSHQSKESKQKVNEKKKKPAFKHKEKSESAETGSQINILQVQLSNGSYECMVCCDRVKQHHAIWNCSQCFHVFHMGCIRKWARSESARVDGGGYRCPACQGTFKMFPNAYYCYCGKMKNPEWNHNEMAHSCGEVCGKKRNSNKNCEHRCNILCHPGPCPPCPTMVDKFCNCGKTTRKLRCGQVTQFACESECRDIKNCGIHVCDKICHAGECSPCEEKVEQGCFCSKETRSITCGSILFNDTKNLPVKSAYSCENTCDKLLDCGNHHCKNRCHEGDCKSCDLLPTQIQICPCTQTKLKDIFDEDGNSVIRKTCLDPIPVCKKICNKPLRCGGNLIHYCQQSCHDGSCPPCESNETIVMCKCGKSELTFSCSSYVEGVESGKDYVCDRRCNKKRKCGRHKCGQICCTDTEHICSQICGKKLSCGLHRCEDTCHRGQCHSCFNVSFEDLTCHCGAELILPPIQCGTKPPECNNVCTRDHGCYHPVQHTCHSEEKCPPCVQLIKKTCNCGRVVRSSIPCYQENVSCGLACGRPLNCGHKCLKTCHAGQCLTDVHCKQSCTIMRVECIHPCANTCHHGTQCPSTPCKAPVTLQCKCGNRQKQVECHNSLKLINEVIGSQQFTGSVDISVLCQNNTRFMPCNEHCRINERNKRMAEALNINTAKLDEDLDKRVFSTFLVEMANRDIQFIKSVEQELSNLVDSVKWLGKPKTHSFAPTKRDKRQVVHELAEIYLCKSQSFDEEPKRSVTVSSTPQCKIPNLLLSNMVKQNLKPERSYEKRMDVKPASENRLLKSMKLVSLNTSSSDDRFTSGIVPTGPSQVPSTRFKSFTSDVAYTKSKDPEPKQFTLSKSQPPQNVKPEKKQDEIDYFDVTD